MKSTTICKRKPRQIPPDFVHNGTKPPPYDAAEPVLPLHRHMSLITGQHPQLPMILTHNDFGCSNIIVNLKSCHLVGLVD
ncbi:hypothetical protein BDW74DRAFT_155095 [Aspergillus multicolor]|uniref:uncharacterized protein n=1 Tax=Aspergillus multicolor TaxID=41759 RepID=UPI003CCDF61F